MLRCLLARPAATARLRIRACRVGRQSSRDIVADRVYRDFARAPVEEGIKLSGADQFVASRVTAREHLPCDFRLDYQRAFPIGKPSAVNGHVPVLLRLMPDMGK